MGYQPNAQKGRINEELSNFLLWLCQRGYIKVKSQNRWYTKYQALEKMDEGQFASIRYSEYLSAISQTNKSCSLLLLAYIRINIYKRTSDQPEMFFCHLREIPDQLGLSYRATTESINTLSSLGLIYYEEQPRYQDKHGNWHSGLCLFINKVRYKNNEIDESYAWQEHFDSASMWLSENQAKYIDFKNQY